MKARKLLWLLPVLAVVGYVACRKTDSRATEEPSPQVKESRFFSEHKSSNPQVQGIVKYLERQNEKQGFVEKTVKKIGYPRWDKTFIVNQSSGINPSGRLENEDTTTIYYIPFVRDSQNYVNASLLIRTQPSDTAVQYLMDWQYQNYGFDSTVTGWDAKDIFYLFANFDKAVFGRTAFKITDNRLFGEPAPDEMVVVKLKPNEPASNLTELLISVTMCGPVDVCYGPAWYDDWCGGGCTVNCEYYTHTETQCVTFWIEDGWQPGGGTGPGSGSGTGGGGSTGGSGSGLTPGDCGGAITPTSNLIETNAPCTPGWEPIGPEVPYVPPVDTCGVANNAAKNMDSIYIKSKADSMLNTIPNLATETKEKVFPIYRRFSINSQNVHDTTYTSYFCGAIQTGTDSNYNVSFPIHYLAVQIATLHTHPAKADDAHSAFDVYQLIAKYIDDPRYNSSFVASANGTKFVITITNPSQAVAAFSTIGNSLIGSKWDEESDIGKAFVAARDYYKKLYKNNPNNVTLSYEMAMAAVLTQFNTGITLSKMDANGNFKPLIIRTVQDPYKPRKKIYTQICL